MLYQAVFLSMTTHHTGSRAASRTRGAPNFAASARRQNRHPRAPALPVAARSLTRPSNARCAASVIETKEVHMTKVLDIYAEIAELRAELAHCILTRKERRESQRRLEELLAEAERRSREAEGA